MLPDEDSLWFTLITIRFALPILLIEAVSSRAQPGQSLHH